MDLGLNIASVGMLAEQVQEDQIANDLANASTPGFKPASSTERSFDQMLLYNTANGRPVGPINLGVEVSKARADLRQGPLQNTGQPLDFAVSGPGFFGVRTPGGVEYTRNGRFSVDRQGVLVDQNGDQVLSQNRAPVKVGASGSVPAAALGLFTVTNPSELGNNNFSGAATTGRAKGTIHAGELEGSGINPVQEMVRMEAALNAYTAGQQTIGTIGQTMQESAASVGQVP